MTAADLAELSLEELDKMSMAQLEEFFRPYWPVTRPERKPVAEVGSGMVDKSSVPRGPRNSKMRTDPNMIKLMDKLSPEKLQMLKEFNLLPPNK